VTGRFGIYVSLKSSPTLFLGYQYVTILIVTFTLILEYGVERRVSVLLGLSIK
jgi:hypothetical protein